MQIKKIIHNKYIIVPDNWIIWTDILGIIVSVESPDGKIYKI